jgi:hydroxybutyrate-dimer hydrolase
VEKDRDHRIDGLAVGEQNVNPKFSSSFTINKAGYPPLAAHSKPLIDYITLVNVFQGCANALSSYSAAPLNFAATPARCASLQSKGLLSSSTLDSQAAEAQAIINNSGILVDVHPVFPSETEASQPQHPSD